MAVVKSMEKSQLFFGIEDQEGTPKITPYTGQSNDSAVFALEMQPIEVQQEMEDTSPATPSYSPEEMAPGAERPEFTFQTYLRGSGDTTLSRASVPDIGDKLRACGMINGPAPYLSGDGGVQTEAFVPGERVLGGTSGATGTVLFSAATGQTEVFIHPGSGAFQDGETVTGQSSGATLVLSEDTQLDKGHSYRPVSRESLAMAVSGNPTGSFEGGEVVIGQTSEAAGVLIGPPGNGVMAIEPALGAFEAGETVQGQRSGATISLANAATPAVVVPLEMPSATILQNIDGIATGIVAARMNAEFNLQAGNVMRGTFTVRGQVKEWGDFALNPTITKFGRDSAGSLQFASGWLILDGKRVPMSQFGLNLGNTLDYNEDANGAGGIGSAKIFGRSPTLTIDPNKLPDGVLNWREFRRRSTKFAALASIGTEVGNRVAIFCPRLQCEDVTNQNDNSRWRNNVTAKPLADSPAGNDEIFIYFA